MMSDAYKPMRHPYNLHIGQQLKIKKQQQQVECVWSAKNFNFISLNRALVMDYFSTSLQLLVFFLL